ncbi:hypothetical protein ACN47E_004424 [Coniothyrium glycines]
MRVFASLFVASGAAIAMAVPLETTSNGAGLVAKRDLAPNTANSLTTEETEEQRKALILAGSEQARLNLLLPNPPDASNMTYQFINHTVTAPTGGTVFLGTVGSFPALVGTDVSMGIGFVNPCGLNTPHYHPRANELLTVTQGTLIAGLILEQDTGFGNVVGSAPPPRGPLPQVTATLSNYTGFLFPRGLVHWQFNPTCEPAVFVAAFDSRDPGRAEVAHTLFSAAPGDVNTGYEDGGLTADILDRLRATGTNSATQIIESCARRCGIAFQKRSDFLYT